MIGRNGILGWVGNAIGWHRVQRFWDLNTKTFSEDWLRLLVKRRLRDDVCNQYGEGSNECIFMNEAKEKDTTKQSKKWRNRKPASIQVYFGYDNERDFIPIIEIPQGRIPQQEPAIGGASSQPTSPTNEPASPYPNIGVEK